ncbi:MAG: hypothetical protein JWP11_1050 [Frankiales bacterium]|nr:hypothetical protein [Frankiales bacterium]
MNEVLAFDPKSVYAAQKDLFDALTEMSANVERPLRRIDYPEMPAGVHAVVEGVVAETIAQISQARVSVASVAHAIKTKSYDLVEHDDPSKLPWYFRFAPNVVSVTLNGSASGYLPIGLGDLPKHFGGTVGVNVGLISDADGVHFTWTYGAGTGFGKGVGAAATPTVGGSYDAQQATDARGQFVTVTGSAGPVTVSAAKGHVSKKGQPERTVHFGEIGAGGWGKSAPGITVSPNWNNTHVTRGWNFREWMP